MILSLVSCIKHAITCNFDKSELCLELEWFFDNVKGIKGNLLRSSSPTSQHKAHFATWMCESVMFKSLKPPQLMSPHFSGLAPTITAEKNRLSQISWLTAEKIVQPADNMKNSA